MNNDLYDITYSNFRQDNLAFGLELVVEKR